MFQVIHTVQRDFDSHTKHAQEETQKELIDVIRARLNEFKDKMRDELDLSLFNKKKTPTAVFNHLTTLVHKHLDFLPQQPALYAALTQLRDDELLRCLFNVSIYLGTIEKPDTFIPELKKLLGLQEGQQRLAGPMEIPPPFVSQGKMSKKDRNRMKAMVQQQQQLAAQMSNISSNNDPQVCIIYISIRKGRLLRTRKTNISIRFRRQR